MENKSERVNTHNYKNFHYLVEIAENLRKTNKDVERFSTPASREEMKMWLHRMEVWLKVNYDNNGIIKDEK